MISSFGRIAYYKSACNRKFSYFSKVKEIIFQGYNISAPVDNYYKRFTICHGVRLNEPAAGIAA